MTSIFENCVVDLDLLHQIGKYVVINRSKLKYNKVVEEFNFIIKQMKCNLNVDIDTKLNYFYELNVISKIYKIYTFNLLEIGA